jgi:hypothetical protein
VRGSWQSARRGPATVQNVAVCSSSDRFRARGSQTRPMALFTLFPQRECSKRLLFCLLFIIYYVLFIMYYLLIIYYYGLWHPSSESAPSSIPPGCRFIVYYVLFIIYYVLLWTLASEQRVCPSKNSPRLPPRFGSSL